MEDEAFFSEEMLTDITTYGHAVGEILQHTTINQKEDNLSNRERQVI